MHPLPLFFSSVLATLLWVSAASAWVVDEDPLEEESTEIGVVARSFAFLSAGPVLEPPLAPEGVNPTGQSIFDARLYALHKTPNYRLVVHNQSTMSLTSFAEVGGLNLGRGVPPPRLLPLTFDQQSDGMLLRNMTDWLFAEWRLGAVTFTVGRQPVTMGRGAAWHTNDLVSTFALTEVNKQFKPGADAVRLDWSLPERQNLMLVAAFGDIDASRDNRFGADRGGSTGLVSYKKAGEFGEFSLMAGYVRGDGVVSLDGTTSVLGFDLYGELTGTRLSKESLAAPAVDGEFFVKALVGASLRPTSDLTIVPEVFYSGAGAAEPSEYLSVMFSDRFQIGDQTSAGRYYASLSNLWQVSPLSTLSWGMMSNLADPSALFFSALGQSLSDDVTGQLGFYAPIGQKPAITGSPFLPIALQSEFGTYPYFFFAQLSATL